jgi:hypothetical protein
MSFTKFDTLKLVFTPFALEQHMHDAKRNNDMHACYTYSKAVTARNDFAALSAINALLIPISRRTGAPFLAIIVQAAACTYLTKTILRVHQSATEIRNLRR